jgi:hypothetical protein
VNTRLFYRAAAVLPLLLATVTAAAGTIDRVEIISNLSVVEGRVGVEYLLRSEDASVFDLTVEYDVGGIGLFVPATEATGGSGTERLASSVDGIRHVFMWDAVADLGRTRLDFVTLRFRASDGTPPLLSDTSGDFEVDTYVLAREVRGIIRDARNDGNLSQVQVQLNSSETGELLAEEQSSDGIFSAAVGILGPVDLTLTALGYETLRIERLLPPLDLPIRLQPDVPESPAIDSAAVGADEVQIRWSGTPEDDLLGYNIYRSTGADFERINPVPLRGNIFEDLDVFVAPGGAKGGSSAAYGVTAVHSNGNESSLDNFVEDSFAEIRVFIPDVEVPVGGVARLQVSVRNASGISLNGIDIKLAYPAGAAESGFFESTALSQNFFAIPNINTGAGFANLSGISSEIMTGEGHIFDLYLQLAPSVAAGAIIPVDFTELKLFDALARPIPSEGLGGVIRVGGTCREGDLNEDAAVDADDVALALAIVVGRREPNACQRRALDLNGDARLDASDVVMLRRLVEGQPINPDFKQLAKGLDPVDVVIQVGSVAAVEPGDEVTVPITVSEADGITGFDIALAYIEQRSNLIFKRVEPGALTAAFQLDALVEEGIVRLTGAGFDPLAPGAGDIANLVFEVAEAAPGLESFPLTLSSFELKGAFGDSFQWTRDTTAVDGTLVTAQAQPTPFLLVTLTDECTEFPLPGAEVVYNSGGSTLNRTTNAQGVASFEFVGGGAFTLTASLSGRERVYAGSGTQTVMMTLPALGGGCGAPLSVDFMDDFDAIDGNGDGLITIGEARAFYEGISDTSFYEKDYDADGLITVAELHQQTSGPTLNVADRDGNRVISLSELLRVVQLYNVSEYSCAANPGDTEDGYRLGAVGSRTCKRHAGDYTEPAWRLTLSELLRVIQVFASGAYTACQNGAGDDGFCL